MSLKQITLSPNIAGLTLYAVIRNLNGQIWNTISKIYEVGNNTNWEAGQYSIQMVEQSISGVPSMFYQGSIPDDLPTGTISVEIRRQINFPEPVDLNYGVPTVFSWNNNTGILVDTDPVTPTGLATVILTACLSSDRVGNYALDQAIELGQNLAPVLRFTTNPQVNLTGLKLYFYVSNSPDRVTVTKQYDNDLIGGLAINGTYSADITMSLSFADYKPGNTYYGALYLSGTDLLAEVAITILDTARGNS